LTKRNKNPIPPQGDSAISQLAEEFIRGSGLAKFTQTITEKFDLFHTNQEKNQSEESQSDNLSPTKASILAFFLWGGGFLYLGQPMLASIMLVSLVIVASIYGSLAGLLPNWIAKPFLHDIAWKFDFEPSLVISAGLLALLWWLNIVIPTWKLRKSISKSSDSQPHLGTLIVAMYFPMVGHFVQGKFWRGSLTGASFLIGLLSFPCVIKFWTLSGLGFVKDVHLLEGYFWGTCLVFSIAFLGTILGISSAFLGVLRELGWLSSQRDEEETEWMFVGLGASLILTVFMYAAVGLPGDNGRQRLREFALKLDEHGFRVSAKQIRKSVWQWEKFAQGVKDQVGLMR